MATLPGDLAGGQAAVSRLRFLRAFVARRPRLRDIDRLAFSDASDVLGLAENRQQLADLALALDRTRDARVALTEIARSPEIAQIAPLRAATAMVAVGADVPRDVMIGAEDQARTEPLVELLCAIRLAADRRFVGADEQRSGVRDATRYARVPRLEVLFADTIAFDERMMAAAVLVAMYSDYAARLRGQVYARAEPSAPQPWALIDWPLLMVHIAAHRRGVQLLAHSPLFLPFLPPRTPILELMDFLEQVAAELDAPDETRPRG